MTASFVTFASPLMQTIYFAAFALRSQLLSRWKGIHELVLWGRQGELEYRAARFIRAGPQPSPMRLDDRPAYSKSHAYSLRLRRVESVESAIKAFRINARP